MEITSRVERDKGGISNWERQDKEGARASQLGLQRTFLIILFPIVHFSHFPRSSKIPPQIPLLDLPRDNLKSHSIAHLRYINPSYPFTPTGILLSPSTLISQCTEMGLLPEQLPWPKVGRGHCPHRYPHATHRHSTSDLVLQLLQCSGFLLTALLLLQQESPLSVSAFSFLKDPSHSDTLRFPDMPYICCHLCKSYQTFGCLCHIQIPSLLLTQLQLIFPLGGKEE